MVPFISIIVCTYNRAKYLRFCLEEFDRQTYPANGFEILVVDNHSMDNTRGVVRDFFETHPFIQGRYIFEPRQGLSNARNRGWRESKGTIIAFIDDDAIPEADWLQSMADGFFEPDIYAVGGCIELKFPKRPPWWLTAGFRKSISEFLPEKSILYSVIEKNELPFGCNLSFRREALELTDGFDPKLGRCGRQLVGEEETQVMMAIIAAGFRVMVQPASVVFHQVLPERLRRGYFFRLLMANLQLRYGPLQAEFAFLEIKPRLFRFVFYFRSLISYCIHYMRFWQKAVLVGEFMDFYHLEERLYFKLARLRAAAYYSMQK